MNDNPATVTLPKAELALLKQEAGLNSRPLARHLLSTARYLGVGALVHAWLLGPSFESDNLWSWAYLLAWPLPVLFWLVCALVVWAFYALILIVVCAALWWVVVGIVDRREARKLRRSW